MTEHVERVNLHALKNFRWFQLMTDFRQRVREVGAETLKLTDLFEAFTEWYEKADAALKLIEKSDYTKKITALDRKRDLIFRGVRKVVKGLLINYNEAKAEAANKVNIIFDTYGDVSKMDYSSETAAIYNLKKELIDNYSAELTLLGLNTDITELDKANKEFINLYETRSEKDVAKELPYSMRDARRELDRIYLDCISRIDVLIIMEGIATWEEFVKGWNERVKHYRQLIALDETLREDKNITE